MGLLPEAYRQLSMQGKIGFSLFTILDVVVIILMFVSPVLFSLDTINETLSLIFLLNPITSFLELFRWVFISDYMINLTFIWINISFIFIIFLIGSKMFIQSERKVADFI